jgi:hypothetical protein
MWSLDFWASMVSATHVIKIYTYTGNMFVPLHMCNGFEANSVNNLPMLVNIHSGKKKVGK